MNHYFGRRDDESEASIASVRVQAEASRSLALLNAIEAAIKFTSNNSDYLNLVAHAIAEVNELVQKHPPEGPLDPNGVAADALKDAAGAAERIHTKAARCLESARADDQLREDDGVVDGFAKLVEAASNLHELIEEFRERIETLDAIKSRREGRTFTSGAEVLSDIRASRH